MLWVSKYCTLITKVYRRSYGTYLRKGMTSLEFFSSHTYISVTLDFYSPIATQRFSPILQLLPSVHCSLLSQNLHTVTRGSCEPPFLDLFAALASDSGPRSDHLLAEGQDSRLLTAPFIDRVTVCDHIHVVRQARRACIGGFFSPTSCTSRLGVLAPSYVPLAQAPAAWDRYFAGLDL